MQLKVARFVSRSACGFAAAVGILFAASTAQAQVVWNNSGTDWNTGANWTGGVPGSTGIAEFNSSSSYTYQPNVGSATQAGAIWDTGAGAVNITYTGAGALTLNGATVNGNSGTGIEMDPAATAMTIGVPVTSSGNLLMNSPGTMTINNTVAFGGLDGSSNPLGIVQIHQGTVQVNSGGALTNTNEIDVGDTYGQTATLTMSGGTVGAPLTGNSRNTNYYSPGIYVGVSGGTGNVTMSGKSVLNVGSNFLFVGVQDNSYNSGVGTITVGGSSVLTAQSDIDIGDGSTGTLTIQGHGWVQANGTLWLGGDDNNGYENANGVGNLQLNGGTLTASNIEPSRVRTGNIYFNGGTLQARTAGQLLQYTQLNAYVQAGGAVIDSNGNSLVWINTSLQHDPSLLDCGRRPDQGRQRRVGPDPVCRQHLHRPDVGERRRAFPWQHGGAAGLEHAKQGERRWRRHPRRAVGRWLEQCEHGRLERQRDRDPGHERQLGRRRGLRHRYALWQCHVQRQPQPAQRASLRQGGGQQPEHDRLQHLARRHFRQRRRAFRRHDGFPARLEHVRLSQRRCRRQPRRSVGRRHEQSGHGRLEQHRDRQPDDQRQLGRRRGLRHRHDQRQRHLHGKHHPGAGVDKLGGNTLTMTGSNNYTGPTTISGGTLQFSSAANQTLSGNISGGGALATPAPAR